MGDTIVGSFAIDTSLTPPDTNTDANVAVYDNYLAGGNSSFVTSGFTIDRAISVDYVALKNDFVLGFDDFSLGDIEDDYVAGVSYQSEGIQLDVRAPEFLTSADLDFLPAFDLTAADVLAGGASNVVFHGFVSRDYGTYDASGAGTSTNYGIASFDLLRLTVGPRTVAVPEPGVLALFGFGLLSFLPALRRRG